MSGEKSVLKFGSIEVDVEELLGLHQEALSLLEGYLDRHLAPLVEKGVGRLTEMETKVARAIARNAISIFMREVGEEACTHELQDYISYRFFKHTVEQYIECRSRAASHRLYGEVPQAVYLEAKAKEEMKRLQKLDPFSKPDGRAEQALKTKLINFVAECFYHKGEE